MTISQLIQILALAEWGSALVLRSDSLILTTETSGPTASDMLPATEAVNIPSSRSTSSTKVHGESTTFLWNTATDSGVRIEPTVTSHGMHTFIPTIIPIEIETNSAGETIIIGPIIDGSRTYVKTETIHFENTASGWEAATSSLFFTYSTPVPRSTSSAAAHFENPTDNWENTRQQGSSKTQSESYISVATSDDLWTNESQMPPVTDQERSQEHHAQTTANPDRVITEHPPPPAITHDGVTIQPVAVTYQRTVTASGGKLMTIGEVGFAMVVGASTLSIGTPLTVNDVVISLASNAAGSTILHVGELTTTLPKPAAGEVHTVAGAPPGQLEIVTSVEGGTTKYVLAGQTLAPGQPVTFGNTPISITINGNETVLCVGNKANTLKAPVSDIKTVANWSTIVTETTSAFTDTGEASASSTNMGSGLSYSRSAYTAVAYYALVMIMCTVTG